jgi:hypothetical protein
MPRKRSAGQCRNGDSRYQGIGIMAKPVSAGRCLRLPGTQVLVASFTTEIAHARFVEAKTLQKIQAARARELEFRSRSRQWPDRQGAHPERELQGIRPPRERRGASI